MILEEELYEDIKRVTKNDYNLVGDPDKDIYIATTEQMLGIIEDLIWEIEHWKEKYEDLEVDLQDNYTPKKDIYL